MIVESSFEEMMLPELDWIETPSALQIMNVISMTHKQSAVTVLYGPLGIGKTMTAKQYLRVNEGAVMLTGFGGSSPSSITKDIQTELNRHQMQFKSPVRLLVVDEIYRLKVKALSAVIGWGRSNSIALLLISSDDIHKHLYENCTSAYGKVLASADHKIRLANSSKKDVELIARNFGVYDEGATQFLFEVNEAGNLLGVTLYLRQAVPLWRETGEPIDICLLRVLRHYGRPWPGEKGCDHQGGTPLSP